MAEHEYGDEEFQRLSEMYVGRWAICSIGLIGKITGYAKLPWGWAWVGKSMTQKPWSSRRPRLLHDEHSQALDVIDAPYAGR